PAPRPAGRPALPGHVVPLQAVEPPVALPDPPPADRLRLAAPGRMDAAATPRLPQAAGSIDGLCRLPGIGLRDRRRGLRPARPRDTLRTRVPGRYTSTAVTLSPKGLPLRPT